MTIASQIASKDKVTIETILDVSQQVTEQWKKINSCQSCVLDQRLIYTLANALEKFAALYEAASLAYTDDGEREDMSPRQSNFTSFTTTPTSASPSVVCFKCQMVLGEIVLDDDEANLLARQVIHGSLVTLGALLQDLRDHWSRVVSLAKEDAVREVDACIHRTLCRLLRVLGRIKPE
ncbi:hypothetical protein MMC18_004549 [Xylographa bjoerkii]|nr:hypothetical protein [Xylographa bjoerkii]